MIKMIYWIISGGDKLQILKITDTVSVQKI